jgi:3-deoxy-D-manno-octulosonic-acid transferase
VSGSAALGQQQHIKGKGASQDLILRWIYNLVGVPFLFFGFHLLGLFNAKVAAGIRGRRKLWAPLRTAAARWPENVPRIWIHASSMGELEQARPLVSAIRQQLSDAVIVVTLFSPSARENVDNLPDADFVSYLPFDSYFLARRFVRLVRPDALLIVRHDIWPNHLWQARSHGARTMLVDASVSRRSILHNPILRLLNRLALSYFDHVLAVTSTAAADLQRVCENPNRIQVVGDTRYDRVFQRAREQRAEVDFLRRLLAGRWIVVAGSTWPSDEEALLPAFIRLRDLRPDAALVLVPHEPTTAHLERLRGVLEARQLRWKTLTGLQAAPGDTLDVVVVDKVGLLANLYAVTTVAFVGGGFGPGVHSVLEPAVHGVPLLFGTRMTNSAEASLMLEEGFAAKVASSEEIYQRLSRYQEDEALRQTHGAAARQFVEAHLGASERIARLVVEALG